MSIITSRLKLPAVAGVLALGVGFAAPVAAHTPLAACYDMGDGTVLCEGGFSDGSSAAGVPIRVMDGSGAVLIEGKMSDNSEFEFEKPDGEFNVMFDAGEGHQIEIPGSDIVQ
ncbi:hypothetical protein [Roseospirillum parvum]|uniref:Uncharacterized protein n=1 Tax=Roseospirillum parvum TaxID=83401 RepID=A0A1G8FJC5_9PROT|nr:hypothetical protein [Roseospirillum parvum]SDH82237.1 hypothetical protein SAMN05421742_11437 [Roseospirillum parvum]